MSNIQIRKATAADVDNVYRFVCELEDMVFDRVLFGEYYTENIGNSKYHYLLAIDNGVPVGYLSCHGQLLLHHLNYVYEIQELFVDTAYRGKGIGKLLVAHLEGILADKEYDMLEVASGFRRTESHEFYKAAGFGQTHYKFTKKKQ
ncbi:MAG: GNAT family N-acetyltransferase [Chitinophagaceae bacterium]|nr:GNAT family N-acetyltransferase [Chitinophagaceae bacterium]MCB9045791.1 GNAT family N-acetyltransferase [Chitinophagales bacterium]